MQCTRRTEKSNTLRDKRNLLSARKEIAQNLSLERQRCRCRKGFRVGYTSQVSTTIIKSWRQTTHEEKWLIIIWSQNIQSSRLGSSLVRSLVKAAAVSTTAWQRCVKEEESYCQTRIWRATWGEAQAFIITHSCQNTTLEEHHSLLRAYPSD